MDERTTPTKQLKHIELYKDTINHERPNGRNTYIRKERTNELTNERNQTNKERTKWRTKERSHERNQ